jgi:hypothetical protein
MSDPIEELSNFDAGVPVNPMPAAEVRRRGERLRRRNAALVVGGAALAVALVAIPIAVFAGDDGGRPQPAGPSGLTTKALLTADEVPARQRLTEWRESPQQKGEVLACAPQLNSLNDDAEAWVRRDFEADVAGGPPGDVPASVVKTEVLQFADDAAARDQYDRVRGLMFGCPGGDDLATKSVSAHAVVIDRGQGEVRRHDFFAPDICTDCDAIRFDHMGVAHFDDRLVMVSFAEVGGPLEPEGLDATMEELFDAAVTKAGGEVTGVPEEEDSAPEPDPVDFPIDWDLVDMTGDGGEIRGPGPKAEGAAEVSPCDRVVWPATGVDRLAVTTTGPEFAESRELVVFASADQAAAIMEDVRSAIAACPTEVNDLDPTNSPELAWDVLQADTGYDDSVTFSQTYTDGMPGGQVWQLTRVGRAIIAVSTGGEYSRGKSASSATVRLTEITDHMTQEMCDYTEAGC